MFLALQMALNEKQQRFVTEYLVDLNGTQAAVRAGYSIMTATAQASRLLTNGEVQRSVSEAMEARSKATGVTAAWLLKRLHDEAEADVADLYDQAGRIKPVKDWPMIWRKGLVAGLDIEEFRANGEITSVIKKIKVSDRIRRLELIGKHIDVGAFLEKVEHSGAIAVTDQRAKVEAEVDVLLGTPPKEK